MHVTLNPTTEKFIQSQVEAGIFASPDQMVEEAIARMISDRCAVADMDELDEDTMASINEAQAEFERGDGLDGETIRKEISKRIGRAILRSVPIGFDFRLRRLPTLSIFSAISPRIPPTMRRI